MCKNKSIIYSALLKGGYNNFEFYILEYCDKNYIVIREQYYIDLLKPEFFILKKAGPSLRYKYSYCKKALILWLFKMIYKNIICKHNYSFL